MGGSDLGLVLLCRPAQFRGAPDHQRPAEPVKYSQLIMVNINFIRFTRITEGNDYTIVLKNIEDQLAVSQSRITQLKEWFA